MFCRISEMLILTVCPHCHSHSCTRCWCSSKFCILNKWQKRAAKKRDTNWNKAPKECMVWFVGRSVTDTNSCSSHSSHAETKRCLIFLPTSLYHCKKSIYCVLPCVDRTWQLTEKLKNIETKGCSRNYYKQCTYCQKDYLNRAEHRSNDGSESPQSNKTNDIEKRRKKQNKYPNAKYYADDKLNVLLWWQNVLRLWYSNNK